VIICGDININYLVENRGGKKTLLDAILITCNLSGTLYFPTRVHNNSSTALGSIFIDTLEFENHISSIHWVVFIDTLEFENHISSIQWVV
jgi:hypothetical protein